MIPDLNMALALARQSDLQRQAACDRLAHAAKATSNTRSRPWWRHPLLVWPRRPAHDVFELNPLEGSRLCY